MLALPEIQSRFYAAIMAGTEPVEVAVLQVLEEDARRGRRRLAAYRRGIFGNLCNALVATYPLVSRIVGLPFFREAARHYIVANPSRSGDLNDYGESFAGFIGDYPHARELPYLADVARLEWLVQSTRHAADCGPADLSILAGIPAERYGDLVFELDPTCARMDSVWPVHAVWRVNQEAYIGDMQVDFSRGCRILLRRHMGAVSLESLSAAEAAFLDALAGRMPLAQAAAAALHEDADFDFGTRLQEWMASGLLYKTMLETSME
ncbi:MAG: DNA-binding domain-containing protein [Rhodocyclales bacterium]|nr:DNA-binding domain-containing protein [Rhodocyclales bacterium]